MFITVPLHKPGTAGKTLPVAQQRQREARGARRVGKQRAGGRGGNLPARIRGTWFGRGGDPDDEQRPPCRPGRERQPAARGEIISPCRPPELDDHRAGRARTRRLEPGLQHGFRLAQTHEDQPRRIEPEFGEPGGMQPPGLALSEAMAHPEQRPASRGTCGKPEREGGGRRRIGSERRIEFMTAGDRAFRRQQAGKRGGRTDRCPRYAPLRRRTRDRPVIIVGDAHSAGIARS